MGKKTLLAAALLALGAAPALAAEETEGSGPFSWGGDLRFRLTSYDEIPTNVPGFAFDRRFNRDRVRLWGKYSPNADVDLNLRFVNEFRFYDTDHQDPDDWKPMTEITPDQIYVDIRNLADGMLDLRIGRQDLNYGNNLIFGDGTPLDGSRTAFHEAIKASLKFDRHTLDLLAMYAASEPALNINDQDRKLVEQDEWALSAYGKYNRFEQTPFEYYWVFKHEDDSRTSYGSKADADFHTFGARVMPKFGSGWEGNLEVALQTGEHGDEDVNGKMLDAALTFSPDIWGGLKPKFSAGYWYLSGNEAGTSDNESWHPVFSRHPRFGELQVLSYVGTQYSVGGWSNLQAPFVGLDLSPLPKTRLILRYYKFYADEKDGLGSGDDRGDDFWALFVFNITPELKGHLWAEWLNTGDYYPDGTEDGAFYRFNLEYSF